LFIIYKGEAKCKEYLSVEALQLTH